MKTKKSPPCAKPRTSKKKTAKSRKGVGGRPTKMTPETVKKLEDAFIDGLTDAEACLLAEITPATLYNYCNEHPEFFEKKELLKATPALNAKRTISLAVKSDHNMALKYLERHPQTREEWSPPTNRIKADITVHDPAERIRRAEERLKKKLEEDAGAGS